VNVGHVELPPEPEAAVSLTGWLVLLLLGSLAVELRLVLGDVLASLAAFLSSYRSPVPISSSWH
jgi:hypothetical protein